MQLDIPSTQNSWSHVQLRGIHAQPTPQSGTLIALAPVTSFYQKGLQLLQPHYDQQLHSLTSSGSSALDLVTAHMSDFLRSFVDLRLDLLRLALFLIVIIVEIEPKTLT